MLPALWRRIEDAHYSYLETDDSPEKLQQREKLEGYIMEYLSIVPHECKFGLAETGKVFQRTITELSQFSAYRAGQGWAAIARYAANLLAQPWRLEYRNIRLYSGFYKHEVEAHMVGAETLLQAMGYRPSGPGRLALEGPVCPDMAAAICRDAIIAQCECQIMASVWEAVWSGGGRCTWASVARERAACASSAAATAARLLAPSQGQEIYSNIPVTVPLEPTVRRDYPAPLESPADLPTPVLPYMLPPMMYPDMTNVPNMAMPPVPMMTYPVPYFYPVQAPYMIPTPMYAPIKHANNVPVNGYPPQYRYPAVPTAQLIELDSPSIYENGKYDRHRDDDRHKKRLESSRRNSTSKSGFSDVSLPSLPRSDTQPALSKAREDGMGTYESWDYVFRNLSSKDQEGDSTSRSRFSPSLDRDSRTLDRLDREERRAKYQPTTLDLEDGLQALNLDRSYDEEMYRTAKVNENLMRLKLEQEQKRAKQLKKQAEDKKRKSEPVGNPKADALITPKVAPDKVRLLTKKDVKDRKEVIKQQNSVNGSVTSVEVKKVKKPVRPVEEKPRSKPYENGHGTSHSKTNSVSSTTPNYDLKAQLIVSLDETDSRPSPRNRMGKDRPAGRSPEQKTSKIGGSVGLARI
ncbi:protein tamozhennic [Leguminivora glycinivorella]|uniref:protein tamozhennic n=1 Tax=Leguminivora glycinivorella TaxID=1035111 RepID=UPI00200EA84D|nr:protein tamozhennic [Leguminivora glycinivorella]